MIGLLAVAIFWIHSEKEVGRKKAILWVFKPVKVFFGDSNERS